MQPVYYDFHIHTALSPCASDEMTPNDIVGMALLNGLDLIAVTDHNSLSNAQYVVKAAQAVKESSDNDLIVLPGVEVSTAEEVHVVCLFSDLESAHSFEKELSPFYSTLLNQIKIFGNQILFDDKDNVIGEEERMLIAPTTISFDRLYQLVHEYGGAFIPAHIDRDSFSVLSNLGFLPPHLNITTLEISNIGLEKGFDKQNKELLSNHKVVYSSDAHQLWTISEKEHFLTLPERTAKAAIDYLQCVH